ncbi:MAG: hypothetical protein MHPSP_004094, partial [Paramarteilia canceri]
RGFENITINIFKFLDFKSLTNCEQASKVWKNIIRKGCVWQDQLEKIQRDPDAEAIIDYADWEDTIEEHKKSEKFSKKMVYTIHQFIEKIEENWRVANCTMTKLRAFQENLSYYEAFEDDEEPDYSNARMSIYCFHICDSILVSGSADNQIRIFHDLELKK